MLLHQQGTVSRRSSNRHGYTLIEMLVTIALSSAIMGVVGTLLHSMLQFDHRARGEIESSRNLARLSILFRSDAHQAISTTGSDGDRQSSLSSIRFLTSNGETTQYTATEVGIDRIRRRGDETVHRDSFSLTENEKAHFQISTVHQQTLASIVITRSVSYVALMSHASTAPTKKENAKAAPPPPRKKIRQTVMRIEAVSGLDRISPLVDNRPAQEEKDET